MDGGLDSDHGQPLLVVLPFTVAGDALEPLGADGLHGACAAS
jgi:hypothetical protein